MPQYDVKAWARETTTGRRLFNYNFHLVGRDVAEWELVKTVPMHRDDTLVETTYLWQRKSAPDRLIRISVSELADWRAAQDRLLDLLNHAMRPDIPRGADKLAEIGDIQYVARATPSDIPGGIQFARGNVAVAVDSVGSVIVDVSGIAAGVDQQLVEPTSASPARAKSMKPSTQTVAGKAKVDVTVISDLRTRAKEWIKVIAPDGELRRKGNTLVYTSPRAGRKSIKILAARRSRSARS